ncbi:LPS O-antigen chain length determinant protein WzzB [Zestomonas carbonaria]|uniref:ECA polysaccharide chain length modulation protein n=1 Tax=Zestomonas carbonaria TaxID=2762745 RepID=A0A7U7IC31_9GAMM|nr:LPS O-antigen chain length determinant protein WzzB [Pseudomonas carbonaria]CAD5109707.1 ECA polysaccharide chain length modulation protein [Pseudomonas carbonaria]
MDELQTSRAGATDEIDLVELVRGLWGQKWLILLVTLLVASGAAAYAFLSKPVYEARVAVLPPPLSKVAGFNLGRTKEAGLEPFKVQDVYAVFTRNLQSDETRRSFFEQVYLAALDEDERSLARDRLYEKFGKKLSIKALDKAQPDRYQLIVEHHDPVLAADWARRYIDDAVRRSLDEMLENAQREIEVKARDVEKQIKSLRETAKVRREDRIVRLREALRVAEAVGLEDAPGISSGQVTEQLSAIMDGSLMYMRGSRALKAEIQTLEARQSDDAFIPALRNLEERYELYSDLQIDPERVAVFRLDGTIETPDAPVKPKKTLILAIGLVLGGMLGVFIALIRLLLKKRGIEE